MAFAFVINPWEIQGIRDLEAYLAFGIYFGPMDWLGTLFILITIVLLTLGTERKEALQNSMLGCPSARLSPNC